MSNFTCLGTGNLEEVKNELFCREVLTTDDINLDAYVDVKNYVRLTRDAQSQDGWLWAKEV